MSNDKPRKAKKTAKQRRDERFYSRSKSERLLVAGADPTETFRDEKNAERRRYQDHPNVHVRKLAWKKMGCPLPSEPEERAKFLASIRTKDPDVKPKPEVQPQPEAVVEPAELMAVDE